MTNTSPYWWLSFADDECKGVAIVRAADLASAVILTHQLGINPGGQVMGLPIPTEKEASVQGYTDQLLTPAEATAIFEAKRLNEIDQTDREELNRTAPRICQEHNEPEAVRSYTRRETPKRTDATVAGSEVPLP